ncbi:hypothetical protein CKO25_10290 [Thiocapsa imhoffii]|uniref:Novel STAND NTPase 1 domain-containing protein n=1 Tax=Thiocapsa imhoffii TaxID=382777 RepID=A0A9X1B986_9GAMM|nr:AAA family ATPase [Thiocapsa imhoffii]MBK1645033.1 hypothetical protein [Thiocapsa imhoffii]
MPEAKVRIFVSSPSDLEHERALVKDVIAALTQEYLPYFDLQAILWEEEALTAAQSFQAGLLRPSECEIVLVMLWTRLGTPLAEDPYGGMTGTEWEFVDAVRASAHTGRPEVLVYKKSAPRMVDVNDAEATREALADRHRLDAFFREHFFNPDGSFSRAFREFANDRSFRQLLETQLRKLLNRRISAERRLAADAGDWRGSPFRDGVSFELKDERVFTGRETESRELIGRLDHLQGAGRGLLLLSGASGVGKSSLIRAGLLPRLVRPFLFPGIAGCRWGLVELGRETPLAALSRALAGTGMLGPALDAFGLDRERLERLLLSEPAVAADQIQAALNQLGAAPAMRGTGVEGRLQLAIIIDPLDPLFESAAGVVPGARDLVRALARLAAREGVWVIASLRSDHLERLADLPELVTLLDEHSWYQVEPPPPARIRQVIEIPARMAGIEYEAMTGADSQGLVEILEAEASRLEHWPAVLAPALNAIYRRATETASVSADAPIHRVLTLADYRQVGGLSGTLLHRAETLWTDLDAALQGALPVLCRALVALEGGGRSQLAARKGDLGTLRRNPMVAQLLERLIAARLIVADAVVDPGGRRDCGQGPPTLIESLRQLLAQSGEEWRERLRGKGTAPVLEDLGTERGFALAGESELSPVIPGTAAPADATPAPNWAEHRPVVTLIHPVLFQHWSPVRDWLDEPAHRRDLILRYQISRQSRLWRRTDCNREYLLGERGYAAARRFAEEHPDELEPLEQQFLEQSQQYLVYQRARNRWARLFGLTLATLLVFSTSAALWAWNASREATLNLQRSLLKAADLAVQRGNTPEAVRLALGAGPYLPKAATDTLSRAFTANRLIAMVQSDVAPGVQPMSPAFRDDGQQLVTQSTGKGAELWELDGQRFRSLGILADPALAIHSIRFIGTESEMILGIGERGIWRLPARSDQPPDWACGARSDSPIAIAPNQRFLAVSHGAPQDRFAVCVLDLTRPGAPLWDLPIHRGEVRSLVFSPDSEQLLTASRDGSARLLERATGTEQAVFPRRGSLGRPANSARFDPAGRRVAVASADERIRVYDLAGQELAELGVLERDGRSIRIHKSAVREAVFAPDGQDLVAGDDSGQVVRWHLPSGRAEILGHHGLSVEHLRIGQRSDVEDHEPLVLSASLDKTARLWGLITGREVATFSHDEAVSDARFSDDGQRILTYSDLDGSARLWSARPLETLAFHLPSEDHVWHLAMAAVPPAADADPNDRGTTLLATAAFDGRVAVWEQARRADTVSPPLLRWTLTGHQGRVRRVAFSPAADQVASVGHDGTAWVWDLDTGQGCPLHLTTDGLPCQDQGPACPNGQWALFSPDGSWLLTTSSEPDRPVRLWDPKSCAPVASEPPWGDFIAGVPAATLARGPDGTTWVGLGDETGGVRVLRANDKGVWSAVCATSIHTSVITDLAFSPDLKQLATVSEDGRAALLALSPQACTLRHLLEPQAGALYSVDFAPDGQELVTAALDARAQLWSTHGHLIAELVDHKDRIYSAQFSADGRWILTASRDGTVRMWQRPRRASDTVLEPFLILSADFGGVAFAAFSPDGQSIGAAYWDNTTLLWRLWTEETGPAPRLDAVWGRDRSRLALIREAERFKQENWLDHPRRSAE